MTMFDLVKGLQSQITMPKVHTDNFVFRLHSKVSVGLLLLCSLLVSYSQFFGDPIDCVVHKDAVPSGVMDTYCWVHSTFTLPDRVNQEEGFDVAHPFVGAQTEEETTVRHKYYQWVCFTLFLQALFFAVPGFLWKKFEGGKIQELIPNDGLVFTVHDPRMPRFAKPRGFLQKQEIQDAIDNIKKYFISRHDYIYREHRHYFLKFTFCEALTFINVIGQIYFVDFFLGGVFTTYGSQIFEVTNRDPGDRRDPMNLVFPKVTKCTFHKYGPSGSIQNIDGLCVLPLNIINEKIYIVLWFWFTFLATVTAIHFVWRVATLSSGRMRETVLRGRSRLFAKPDDIATVCNNTTLGDWFILVQLGANIDSHIFADLVAQLSKAFHQYANGEHQSKINTDV